MTRLRPASYGDGAWVAKAKRVAYPALELPPEPPPIQISDGFERDAVGKSPRGVTLHTEKKGDSILITDETAAAGKHSLKITDAPGLSAAHNPHFYYRPGFTNGVVSNSFDLRIEKASMVDFEWRDWSATDYHTGIHLCIRDGRLMVFENVIELPLNQWFHVEMTAGLGKALHRPMVACSARPRPATARVQGSALRQTAVQEADVGRLHQQRNQVHCILPR